MKCTFQSLILPPLPQLSLVSQVYMVGASIQSAAESLAGSLTDSSHRATASLHHQASSSSSRRGATHRAKLRCRIVGYSLASVTSVDELATKYQSVG